MKILILLLKALRKYFEEQRIHNSALIKDLERERLSLLASHSRIVDFIDNLLKEIESGDNKNIDP